MPMWPAPAYLSHRRPTAAHARGACAGGSVTWTQQGGVSCDPSSNACRDPSAPQTRGRRRSQRLGGDRADRRRELAGYVAAAAPPLTRAPCTAAALRRLARLTSYALRRTRRELGPFATATV